MPHFLTNEMEINIANYLTNISTLGPGNRFVLWVQGCPFTCKNCISPDYLPFHTNRTISVNSLLEIILASNCDGLTISGGEPFAQAEALSELLEKLRLQRPDMNVLVFTGYSYKNLRNTYQINFLKYIDLLIPEPFEESLNSEHGLRGSDNQPFLYLTDRLIHFKNEIEMGSKKMETIVVGNTIQQVGIMSKSNWEFHQNFKQIMANI